MISPAARFPKINDSFIFVFSVFLSALMASPFIGLRGAIVWTSFAVLCTYSLYSAKDDKVNIYYIALWMFLIFISAYIGRLLHLSWLYYLYLFALSYLYYYYFGKDPICDRAIRFIIILSTIGTAMPEITKGLPIGATIGTCSALLIYHYMMRKNKDLDAFRQGIFTYKIFKPNKFLLLRAFIYSCGVFFCLIIPHYLGVNKNYWATITFLMVITPKATTVFHNTIWRFLGSIIAVSTLYILFQIPIYITAINVTDYMMLLFAIFAFFLPLCFGKNFGLVAFGVTCYSLVLVEISMYWQHPAIALLIDRIIETGIGGVIAIVISIILKAIHDIPEE